MTRSTMMKRTMKKRNSMLLILLFATTANKLQKAILLRRPRIVWHAKVVASMVCRIHTGVP
jgi:hypothetical protein